MADKKKPDYEHTEELFAAEQLYSASIVHMMMRDEKAAVEDLRASYEAMPTYAPTILALGSVEYQLGRREQGRGLLMSLLDLDDATPDLAELVDRSGEFLIDLGEYGHGLELYRRGAARFPRTATMYMGLSCCAGHTGLHAEAVEASRAALALEPDSQEHVNDLGWSLLEAGAFHDALEALSQAARMDPTDELASGNLRVCRGAVESLGTPPVLLLGPPGVGKSALGRRACHDLAIAFLDLSTPETDADSSGRLRERALHAIEQGLAAVIALPWSLQSDRRVLAAGRRTGTLLLLWDHPENMIRRARDPIPIPSPRLRTRGGFGRTGTRSRTFRSLEKKCDEISMLVDLGFEDAAAELRASIEDLRARAEPSVVEREDLDDRAEEWIALGATPAAARVLAEAMAGYLARLRRDGASKRTLAAVTNDLDAAASLVFEYESPTRGRILESFSHPPWTGEFQRKFSDSPRLLARYERNLGRFARFLDDES